MICTQPASTMTRCLASWIVPAYPPPSLPLQQAPSTGRCTSSPSKHKPNKGWGHQPWRWRPPCPPHLPREDEVELKSKTRPARPNLSPTPALQSHHPTWQHCPITAHCKWTLVYFRFKVAGLQAASAREGRRTANWYIQPAAKPEAPKGAPKWNRWPPGFTTGSVTHDASFLKLQACVLLSEWEASRVP